MSVLNLAANSVHNLDGEKIVCSVSNDLVTSPLVTEIRVEMLRSPLVSLVTGHDVVEQGGTLSARCVVSDLSSVEVSWWLGGQLLQDQRSEEIKIEVTRNHDLQQLECRATNQIGTGSDKTTIHVQCESCRAIIETSIYIYLN